MTPPRTHREMFADAQLLLEQIREAGREPHEFEFHVSEIERLRIIDQPPFHLAELDIERTKIFGIPIVLPTRRSR